MSALSFLWGKWRGSGWYQKGASRSEFDSTETIASNLDGKLFVMEGFQTSNGQVVNHALTIISYDPANSKYGFDSYVDPGSSSANSSTLYHGNYPFNLSANGQWNEIGESSQDGKDWIQFFGMTLTKVNPRDAR